MALILDLFNPVSRPRPGRLAPAMRRAAALWALGAVLALSACGGGGAGGGDEPPPPTAAEITGDFFAMHEGDRWIYDWNDAAEVSVRVTGRRSVQGADGWVVQARDSAGIDGESVYTVSASRVQQIPVSLTDPVLQAVGAIDVMRFPLHAGDRFVQIDKTVDAGIDVDGDNRTDPVAVLSEVLVVGVETVDTPAGRFEGALHQRTVMTLTARPSGGSAAEAVQVTVDDWYAAGLGPVRSELRTRVGERVVDTFIHRLKAYRVGDRRSESTAPALVSTEPPDGTVRTAVASVVATFDETLDAATASQAFTLRDAGGQLIAGSVHVDGSTLRFTPAQALASGRYSARLDASVEDRVGNAIGSARVWSFDVDTTAPGLLGSTPADGATDVARDAAIVLRFSEALDPATVHAGTVIFSGGTVDIAVSGATITLTPTATLARLTDYSVQLTPGVQDLAGNALASGTVVHFRTDSGRFAPAAALPAPTNPAISSTSISPMAVGDVDGDGRPEVLAAAFDVGGVPSRVSLLVWHPGTDGSVGPPDEVSLAGLGLADGCGLPGAIELGDLDGDGRTDVALSLPGCGIVGLRQGSNGRLELWLFLPAAAADKLRLVDLDRDGRLDIVSVGASSDTVQVWRQAAPGMFVLAVSPAVTTSMLVDLATGDLNSDGRPDLVLAGVSAPGSSVAVLLQQPDGSFGPPDYLPTDGLGVAVADVDGDGRDDLVVTIGSNAPAFIAVFRQRIDGTLAARQLLPSHDIPLQVVAADVNGDGRKDVVVGHSGWNSVGVYLQQADGQLAPEARYAARTGGYNPRALVVRDLDGDARPDIVIEGQVLWQRAVAMQSQGVPSWTRGADAALRMLRR